MSIALDLLTSIAGLYILITLNNQSVVHFLILFVVLMTEMVHIICIIRQSLPPHPSRTKYD